jgi:hypothetical protein
MALQGQLAVLRSQGLVPEVVYTDPHSTFRSMTQNFPRVSIDIGGAGDYVAKVDAKICRIKDTSSRPGRRPHEICSVMSQHTK